MPGPTRILIVEDHPLTRARLRELFEESGFDVVGEADSDIRLFELLKHSTPDVVLFDLLTAALSRGVAALERLRREYPGVRVIVHSGYAAARLIRESLKLGAVAYITKSDSDEGLAGLTRDILDGKPYEPVVIDDHLDALTPREFEVLQRLTAGSSNHEISAELFIAEQTVKFHLSNIYRKLGVSSRAEAAAMASAHGVVPRSGE